MKNIIISATVFTLVCVAVFLFISFAWVGAEHIIESEVHFGTIDRVVAGVMSIRIINMICDFDKRYRVRTEEGKSIKGVPEHDAR